MNMYKLGEALAKQAGPMDMIRTIGSGAKTVGKAAVTPKGMMTIGATGAAATAPFAFGRTEPTPSFLDANSGYLGAGVGSLAGAGLGLALAPKKKINPLTGEEEGGDDLLPMLGGAALGGLGGYYAAPHIANYFKGG